MWGCITTLGWMIQVGGSIALVYLVYKTIRLLLSDCDLTVKSKTLKSGYFKGKVVWVTGASSGSKCCMQKCIQVSGALYVVLSVYFCFLFIHVMTLPLDEHVNCAVGLCRLLDSRYVISISAVSGMVCLCLWNMQLTMDCVRIELHGAYPRKSAVYVYNIFCGSYCD